MVNRLVSVLILSGSALLGCSSPEREPSEARMDVQVLTREAQSAISPAEALQRLKDGNERFAAGRPLPLGLSTNLLTQQDHVTGVVAVFQDLTEVREMERRVRRNETLAEVGALSAGIAHELRNGLKPISGSVECLQR